MRRNAGRASVRAKGFLVQKMALGQQRLLQCKEVYMSNSEWLTCYTGGANDLFMYYGETEQFQVIFHASVMNALYNSVLKARVSVPGL